MYCIIIILICRLRFTYNVNKVCLFCKEMHILAQIIIFNPH